jgi:Cytochrome P460
MSVTAKSLMFMSMVLFSLAAFEQNASQPKFSPEYTSDSQLRFPEHYREWVYLTTGFDMSYSAGMQMGDHHMFDNVFVNPEAYAAFVKTGTWPDKTMLVLEGREAKGKGSINQRGNYQGVTMGLEVHVKDEAHFPGKWAFFGFDGGKTASMIPTSADCYSCHAHHAAVDTTFVQFYPTLLPIATTKGTLSAEYLKEIQTKPAN